MHTASDMLLFAAVFFACVFIAILILTVAVMRIDDFSQDLKYIKREIRRTRGREQKYWKREKRRLWLSLLPFFPK